MAELHDYAALAELSTRCGILLEYYDIWGNHHPTSVKTQQALLSAMGIDVSSDEAIRAALQNPLITKGCSEQVHVMREHEQIHITIAQFKVVGQMKLRWILTEENGDTHSGELALDELKQLEESYQFRLPHTLPTGYHRLTLQDLVKSSDLAVIQLIVTPERCYQPPALANGQRAWGIALQLYALRSQRNWGIGDFNDLLAVIDTMAELGAATIGLNPLHALYPSAAEKASPYSPSSRLFLNSLYLSVETIADFAECEFAQMAVQEPEFQTRLQKLRVTRLVDYKSVAELKFSVLRMLYEHFRHTHLAVQTERAQAFYQFQTEAGEALRLHVLFEALQAYFNQQEGYTLAWRSWPEAYRDSCSSEVSEFAKQHALEIEFYQYLQWQTALQLDSASEHAAKRGLELSIYRDLALGSDNQGADVWANQSLYAHSTAIGAPPDDFSPTGQDWGLPPIKPQQLWQTAFEPFIVALRANMQNNGALRIDHVMNLQRLFWVPSDLGPAEGAYVTYPFKELLGILALESQRNRCLIIGEDLGTVPNEVRAALWDYGVFSYRVLYFEKHWQGDGSFKQPGEYPTQALVTASTHDLPTLVGFWQNTDLKLRCNLGLFTDDSAYQQQLAVRAQDSDRLLQALEQQGLSLTLTLTNSQNDVPVGLTHAVHSFLARTPAQLMMVQMEDLLAQSEQVNLPGTTTEYPNWQYKLSVPVEDWLRLADINHLAQYLNAERSDSV